jgi:uncharacterized membrane protein
MRKEIGWLWAESKQWVERGLISEEQASKIRGLYPDPKAGLPWSTIVFSGLGGVIAGLGIILLIAYNWHALHRFTKLGIIFFGMVALHSAGLRLFLRSSHWRQFGEALCLLGSMLFGAGIWLVAQIYHIQEHFPDGFLLWGLGALALAWAMPSIAQGLLAVAILGIWGCSEGWGFDQAIHWAPALLLAGGGLLAWRLRSVLLLIATIAAFVLALSANVTAVEGDLVFRVLLTCSTVFAAAALLAERSSAFPKSARVWEFFGWAGFLICLYLLTFPDITEDLLGWRRTEAPGPNLVRALYRWLPLVFTGAIWGLVAWQARTGRQKSDEAGSLDLESWLLPLTAVLCQVLATARFTENKWFVAGVFNLVFLAIVTAWMARGGRQGLLQPMVLGSVLLVALATARFFDLFESLATRGLIFLLVGAVLGAEGVLFRRARRKVQPTRVSV